MDITIKVEDNTDLVRAELDAKMPEILNALGNELYKSIRNYMTEDNIVDTGRLRGSISYSTPYNDYNQPMSENQPNDFIQGIKEDKTVVYGSNVEYASYVNSGTSRQRARKFIETGTFRAIPQCEKVVEKILKGE